MRLDGVGKRYGVRLPWVVRDVSLEIGPGALVRLEGRNGTGKSTLLRVIAGVSAPSKGSVTGRPVTGYVPERFPPALPFSARDYLSHVGRVHGMTSGELAERIQYCLDRLGGWEFADVPLRNMSKGMCQKVAVAQALLPTSGLLVLDEAWTGLDVEAKGALDEVVDERLADGGSVVFVDHDPQRLAQLDAQRWRIEDGQARPAHGDGAEAIPAPAGGAFGVVEPGESDSEPGSAEGAAAEVATVLIEVAGYPHGGPDPGGLRGVLSARADGDRWLVRVAPQDSGAVLRALLAAGDAVQVLEVRKPEARP